MSTFAVGAGTKLAAGLQLTTSNPDVQGYFNNIDNCVINVPVNITSFSIQPSVEKGTEENLLAAKVKDSSYLLSISVDGSFDANLRPEFTDWIFKAATHTEEQAVDQGVYYYRLADAGSDPVASTLVLKKNGKIFTYPSCCVRTFTLNAPNNDFVTVSCDVVGREEIDQNGTSAIDPTAYEAKSLNNITGTGFTKAGFIVTSGVFKLDNTEYCIESATLTIDNALEDAPRCYQDGQYANIPVMGRRSVTLDFNMPYTDQVETWKDTLLLDTITASVSLEFSTADGEYTVKIEIPELSLTSVDSSISGTGVIEASLSGEAIMPKTQVYRNGEPLIITVTHNV